MAANRSWLSRRTEQRFSVLGSRLETLQGLRHGRLLLAHLLGDASAVLSYLYSSSRL